MKMTKASEKDIAAAGDAMSVLSDISSGYYPARGSEEDAPTFFDPDDADHLRKFYDLMNATLEASPGWPGRVIGGMCFVILYDKNEIVDPAAECLALHPRFAAVQAQRDELQRTVDSLCKAIRRVYDDVGTPGDFGYDTKTGKALCNLYDSSNAARKVQRESAPQPGSTQGGAA